MANDGTFDLTRLQTGAVIADKYRVIKVLGRGGMGVVVAADHLHLQERVAIKFLLPELVENPEALSRFLREARACAKLQSEHVVRVLDVATLPGNIPYIVMEFLEGEDLAELREARGRLEVEAAVTFVLEACCAIGEAHALGIIHRDLKPANLFAHRRRDGRTTVKVLDFGISKVRDGAKTGGGTTKTGAILGSPYYMSPEQLGSASTVDARSDIWSLGVILYELLTGRLPFDGESLASVFGAIVSRDPPPPRQWVPDLPAQLEQVILWCLRKDPDDRPFTVSELARELVPFGSQVARLVLLPRILGVQTNPSLAPSGASPSLGPRVTGAPRGASASSGDQPTMVAQQLPIDSEVAGLSGAGTVAPASLSRSSSWSGIGQSRNRQVMVLGVGFLILGSGAVVGWYANRMAPVAGRVTAHPAPAETLSLQRNPASIVGIAPSEPLVAPMPDPSLSTGPSASASAMPAGRGTAPTVPSASAPTARHPPSPRLRAATEAPATAHSPTSVRPKAGGDDMFDER